MTTAELEQTLSETTRLLDLLNSLILPTNAEQEMIKNIGIKRDATIQLLEERRNRELFQTSNRLAVRTNHKASRIRP